MPLPGLGPRALLDERDRRLVVEDVDRRISDGALRPGDAVTVASVVAQTGVRAHLVAEGLERLRRRGRLVVRDGGLAVPRDG